MSTIGTQKIPVFNFIPLEGFFVFHSLILWTSHEKDITIQLSNSWITNYHQHILYVLLYFNV